MFRIPLALSLFVAVLASPFAVGQERTAPRPNFSQAQQFSSSYIRQRTYSTSVKPNWVGETDKFWYSYRTASGTHYYFVDPEARTKRPLFDQVRLASELSMQVRKPLDSLNLKLSKAEIDDDGKKLSFVVEKTKFELELSTGTLVNLGEVSKDKSKDNSRRRSGDSKDKDKKKEKKDPRAHRQFSPDNTAYVFVEDFNLFYVEASDEVKAEILKIDARLKKEEAEKKKAEAAGEIQVEKKGQKEGTEKSKIDDAEKEDDKTKEKGKKGDQKVGDKKSKAKESEGEAKKKDVKSRKKKTNKNKKGGKGKKIAQDKKGDKDKKATQDKKGDKDKKTTKDKKEGKDEQKEGDEKSKAGETKDKTEKEDKVDERQAWADSVDEGKALQLTDNGEEDYEFSKSRRSRPWSEEILDEDAYLESLQAGLVFSPQDKEQKEGKKKGKKGQKGKKGNDQKKNSKKEGDTDNTDKKDDADKSKDKDDKDEKDEKEEVEDTKTKPRVSWAPDSSAFYISRRDSRGVEELFLVNSLTTPRPSLETYNYPLPGETHIGFSELYIFDRTRKEFFQVEGKWKDESYQNLHWPKAPEKSKDEDAEEPTAAELAGTGDELRLVRRDRLLRNLELCSINTRNGECRVIFDEGFVGANISTQSLRYLKQRGEMIWWSERSGWGHFYLLDKEGKAKNAITSGPFRASRIVEVDQDKGLLYFFGNGRETGENIYHQHLYRVFLDGTGLTLLDPGNANHSSTLSPTQRFLVDNSSRIDMAPVSRLCDADGKTVMELEQADLSRLYASGWTMPETFKFKAADGVTDLYGNMWKPFDFDPNKRYPIIAEVYPGPQTEGVSHSFSSTNGRQQLAQVGFIVVQLGHRGGTPGRSKAYHSYGYNNLRDYGLADKKAGLEQLAERHPYVDLENVGIYGHSGGGFMTAAALLREPYNDFFKVGVSSSGNHDNNVYGRHWAERYHGLKEVEVPKKKGKKGKKDGDAAAEGDGQKDKQGDDKKEEVDTKFEIDVPTNAELAANLKGHLLLVHGDMDNNVHPAGTMRLVDALIKANKRFDMLIIPGKRHSYGNYNAYFTQRKWEFFAEHLLGDHQPGADILEKE